MSTISGEKYAGIYGPTTGDRIRLGDTELFIEIEKDHTSYGDECKFGGGKSIRDGMGQSASATGKSDGVLDTVITNAVVLDAFGVVKGDIGIRDGKIVGVGKAGNPDIMDGVDPDLVIGAGTEVIAGEGLIVTPGGIDTHVHFISPQQVETALYSGMTTLIGGGTGPAVGTYATTCTPGAFHIARMLEAAEEFPVNIGFTGKGNASCREPLAEQIRAGAVGLKLHEDWGSTPKAIDTCMRAADEFDVQVTIHTDSLNEAGFVEDTLRAIGGRTIHTYHSEGAGGGHAPDVIRVCSAQNVLPSSTSPTMPYTVNTVIDHRDMLIVCHHLDSRIREDVAFADSRIRGATIAAEDVLHDLGVFSIINSDSQAMGRIGEVITRTWQAADKMKKQRGSLPEDSRGNDNFRVRRYIAKYTINPAVAHGISDYVGSIRPGRLADPVLWTPALFGAKPEMILKGGVIMASRMGDINASIPTPQPVIYRNMFGAFGGAKYNCCLTFVSQAALEAGTLEPLRLQKRLAAVSGCRKLSKRDMVLNSATPYLEVDPVTFEVRANGEVVTCDPAAELSLTQRYFLF